MQSTNLELSWSSQDRAPTSHRRRSRPGCKEHFLAFQITEVREVPHQQNFTDSCSGRAWGCYKKVWSRFTVSIVTSNCLHLSCGFLFPLPRRKLNEPGLMRGEGTAAWDQVRPTKCKGQLWGLAVCAVTGGGTGICPWCLNWPLGTYSFGEGCLA